jgi:MFS family permease
MLPGTLLTGIGVGLALPTLVAAMATTLPPQRFATGSGINTMARQIGAVLGVAILVSILGRPHTAAAAKTAFDHGWTMITVAGVVAACAAVALRKAPARPAAAQPAAPPAEPAVSAV